MDREGARRVEGGIIPGLGVFGVYLDPPGGRRFWLYDSMLPTNRLGEPKPKFSIATVAEVFFGRSPDWLRWAGKKNNDVFMVDDQPLEIKRTEAGNREYTLVDIERLANALLQMGKIDGTKFAVAIGIVRLMAYQYGVFTDMDRGVSGQVSGQLHLNFEGFSGT